MVVPDNEDDTLISEIYPQISHLDVDARNYDEWFSQRTILAARNDTVSEINSAILDKFPGRARTFNGVDSVIQE
ncbi:uncharacterized protein SCHCODRAFT_02537344, partial [Schizophyllum commune H4-8]|uniref:uncharacterized protein n=1 Tax=Schizophyllum commune (strain H4-8 / FGSC 9210) TaxID=578458 RepID=UPI00215F2E00